VALKGPAVTPEKGLLTEAVLKHGRSSRTDAIVESPGGISPPGAPRTVHDPLESLPQMSPGFVNLT